MGEERRVPTETTVCIAIITIICMVFLYVMQNESVTDVTKTIAINNISTALDAQVGMINEYVRSSERLLRAYGTADEIMDILRNPSDIEASRKAQQYTERFFQMLEDWEGLYCSDWQTKVLTHSTPSAIGMVTRRGDRLEPYQKTMTGSEDGFYNEGLFLSPASGRMILNIRMMIRDEAGKPLGLVGGGPLISSLTKVLERFTVVGMQDEVYTLMDTENNVYVLHSNAMQIARPVADSALREVLTLVKKGKTDGYLEYGEEGKKEILCYKCLPEYHMVLTMKNTSSEVFEGSDAVADQLLIYCLMTMIIIIVAVFISTRWMTKSLDKEEAES